MGETQVFYDIVKKKYDETDPVRLCNAMKIKLNYYPLGTKDGCCKGFYMEKAVFKL